MIHLLHKLYEVVWREELVPPKWRVEMSRKFVLKEDPCNFRGITLLSVVVNDRLVRHLESGGVLHDG